MSLGRLLVLIGLLLLSVVSRAQSQAASLEVDFTVPSGHVVRHEGGLVLITPQTFNDQTCIYGIGPPRLSKGSLEADAEAALLELVVPGWARTPGDYRAAMRGVAPAGWHYFWYRGEFQGQVQGSSMVAAAMAMVFPATANRVNVVFGVGNLARCTFNDVPFAQLFHSLRPRGWPNPAGNALERDLIGIWGGSRLSGHAFDANGRYSSSASGQLHGRIISGEGDGRYALRGSEITITPRVAGQAPERFRVYIYDKWNNSRWQRAMTVLYDDRKPPYVAEYVREGH